IEELRAVLPTVVARQTSAQDARSPGTALRHYSPRARVDLFTEETPDERLELHVRDRERAGERVAVLRLPAEPAEAAQELFAALRQLDATRPDVIVARLPPPGGLGAALRDRLRRTAASLLEDARAGPRLPRVPLAMDVKRAGLPAFGLGEQLFVDAPVLFYVGQQGRGEAVDGLVDVDPQRVAGGVHVGLDEFLLSHRGTVARPEGA